MSVNVIESINSLMKALEAGSYNAAPSTLVQGSALQVEDLSPVMQNVTFDDSHIILQKYLKVDTCKSNLAQFDRQLSYGIFGGSAQGEGQVGQEETSDFVRVVVPMSYYSHVRRVTIVAQMVDTVDGIKAEERAAADAAKKVAGDIEFDLFSGKSNFSNGGVFDGSPAAIPSSLPNILGLDAQIRQSDAQFNAKDLMFGSFGSNDTVVISGGGTLTQDNIEDASVRSVMNMGSADELIVDPKVLSAYNKLSFGKERIILAGTPMDTTSADLRQQFVSGGTVKLMRSRFTSGKTGPLPSRTNGPAAPAAPTCVGGAAAGTPFQTGQVFNYLVSAQNVIGESPLSPALAVTVGSTGTTGAGTSIPIVIAAVSGAAQYNVYRTKAGGAAATARFIGSVAAASGSTTFTDLGNKLPGFVTGFLLEHDTMAIKQLAPYSRLKLAVSDLSTPEASFRFCTLAHMQPRKCALIDNLIGSY